MVGESNQNVFFIHIDASSLAEFEISEFDISRVDCICIVENHSHSTSLGKKSRDKVCTQTTPFQRSVRGFKEGISPKNTVSKKICVNMSYPYNKTVI